VTFPDGQTTQKGKISAISSDPKDLIPQSDLVLWTGPVHSTKKVFESLKPHVLLFLWGR